SDTFDGAQLLDQIETNAVIAQVEHQRKAVAGFGYALDIGHDAARRDERVRRLMHHQSTRPISTPIRRTMSGCCARTASGHAIAELAIALVKFSPRLRTTPTTLMITAGICARRNGVQSSFCAAIILRSACRRWLKTRRSKMSSLCRPSRK